MVVDKQGMIPDALITIDVSTKGMGNQTFYPREIDGLLRVNPGDESSVGLKVTSPDGTCVIGPTPDCKITASTSFATSLYQNIKVGNETLLVGYSGPDQRIQQFSILPSSANGFVPSGQWHVDIIKSNQVSRFYYQVTSVAK